MMKKLTMRTKQRIAWLLLVVGWVVFASAAYFDGSLLQIAIGAVLVFAAITLDLIWWRCPHCGKYLHFHNRESGDFCQKCGKPIYLDEPYWEE